MRLFDYPRWAEPLRDELVELFPEWPGELFPLYALYPSRQYRAAKVRAFVDFAIDALTGAAERDSNS